MSPKPDHNSQPDHASAAPRQPYRTLVPGRKSFSYEVSELWEYRDTAKQFALRDVTLRYRQTALGVIWVLLLPLLAAGAFTFLFGKVAKLSTPGNINYFAFSYAGMMMWSVFTNTLGPASAAVLANNGMIPKVYFPRIILPLYVVAAVAINFVVSMVMMVILLFLVHVPITWAIVTIPVWFLLMVLMGEGTGLIAAAYTVRYRDVQYILPVALQFALFVTPVAFSASHIPQGYRWIVAINPITGLLQGSRWALLGEGPLNWAAISYSLACIVVFGVLGFVVFNRLEREFADVI